MDEWWVGPRWLWAHHTLRVTWHAEGLTQVFFFFFATLNTVPLLNLGPESPARTRLGEQGPSGWPLTPHLSKGWVRCSPG